MAPLNSFAFLLAVTVPACKAFTNNLVHPSLNLNSFGTLERRTIELNVASVVEEDTMNTAESIDQNVHKSWDDDGFVFGLEGSGLERPKGKTSQVVLEGDNLETETWQVAVVAATFAGHAIIAGNCFNEMLGINGGDFALTSVESIALVLSSWLFADLGSGVLHWSVDNYGNGKTPIMGGIIAAFQGHHAAPWTITERGFCNNVYKLCVPFGLGPIGLINFVTGPFVTMFFVWFCVMEIMSQEFHKWSHMTKSECPGWVNTLQNTGLTIGRKPHAQHHMAPYDGNYCIVSGVWNEWLDNSGFFRWMEHIVYNYNGVESNAWKLDQDLKERTLRGEYSLPRRN